MLSETERQTITGVITSHQQMPGALMPILHGIQDAVGFIPGEVVDQIARGFSGFNVIVAVRFLILSRHHASTVSFRWRR